MSRITRVPTGLQALLGSKSLGENPHELGMVVTPVLAMNEFYELQDTKKFWEGVQHDETDNGFLSQNTVPSTEIRLIHRVKVAVRPLTAAPLTDFGARFNFRAFRNPDANLPASSVSINSVPWYNKQPNPGSTTLITFDWLATELRRPFVAWGNSIISVDMTNLHGLTGGCSSFWGYDYVKIDV